jgi:hypothetical protein
MHVRLQAQQYTECKRALVKALHMSPQDMTVRFNLGRSQIYLARSMLEGVGRPFCSLPSHFRAIEALVPFLWPLWDGLIIGFNVAATWL